MAQLKAKINTTSKVKGKQKGQQEIVAQSVRLGAVSYTHLRAHET